MRRPCAQASSIYLSTDGVNYTECKRARVQILGSENIIEFNPAEARYVRFEALGTVGSASCIERYKSRAVRIANLAVLESGE